MADAVAGNNEKGAPAAPPSASAPHMKPAANEGESILKGEIKIRAKIATPQQKEFCATGPQAAPGAPSEAVEEVKKPLVASPEQPGASTWYCGSTAVANLFSS